MKFELRISGDLAEIRLTPSDVVQASILSLMAAEAAKGATVKLSAGDSAKQEYVVSVER